MEEVVNIEIQQTPMYEEIVVPPAELLAKKPKYRVQRYKKEWERRPELRDWLRPGDKATSALCIACDRTIGAHLHTIQDHRKSKRHQELAKKFVTPDSNSSAYLNGVVPPSHLTRKMAAALLRLAAFFSDHNIDFPFVAELIPLLQEIFKDHNVLRNLYVKRMKINFGLSDGILIGDKDNLTDIDP